MYLLTLCMWALWCCKFLDFGSIIFLCDLRAGDWKELKELLLLCISCVELIVVGGRSAFFIVQMWLNLEVA